MYFWTVRFATRIPSLSSSPRPFSPNTIFSRVPSMAESRSTCLFHRHPPIAIVTTMLSGGTMVKCASRIVAWQELASLLALVALPNCGGSVSNVAQSDGFGIFALDASVEANAVFLDAGLYRGPDGLPDALGNCSVPCPLSEPTVGDSCEFVAACEYGGSPFAQCNRVYDCPSGHVAVVSGFTLDASACPLGLLADCPASRATIVQGESCGTANGLQCVYIDGECDCLPGNGTSPTWECSGADASVSPGCPVPRAMLGTPCRSAGESCQQISTRSFEVCSSSCGNRWDVELVPAGNSATPLLSDHD
jgi:hypothetical protein